jgi:putative N6-adenine-specific DNA methylase
VTKTDTVYRAAALCAVGAEKALSNEVRKLGLKVAESGFGKVRFEADIWGLYRALMGLRTADRVLLEAADFPAGDFDALFKGVAGVAWERLVPPELGLKVVKVRSNRSALKAETSIQAVAHKAAAERLCKARRLERLSESGPCAELRIYMEKDRAQVLLDLSGEPLFKRGYRSEGGAAPLRETTAAALVLLSGWKRKFPLYDPFCGSGTILIEAAMYAWDMAPCLGRAFALDDLGIADARVRQAVREDFLSQVNFENLIRIAGSDGDVRAASIARSNAERAFDIARGKTPERGIRAGAGERPACLPEIKALPMEEAQAGGWAEGLLLTNPPYGKRLGDKGQAEKLYGEMPLLLERFPGWRLAVISDHPGFESFFGSKAASCREISNGAIPSYFYEYDRTFTGTEKIPAQPEKQR